MRRPIVLAAILLASASVLSALDLTAVVESGLNGDEQIRVKPKV